MKTVQPFQRGESISSGEVREHLNELVSGHNDLVSPDTDIPLGHLHPAIPRGWPRAAALVTATSTWTAPSGVTIVLFRIQAAGGGGGHHEAYSASEYVAQITSSPDSFLGSGGGGGGGSGGTYDYMDLRSYPGKTYSITIGTGGAAGASAGSNGADGGDTVVGSRTAFGGGGGLAATGTGHGGRGGTGGKSASNYGSIVTLTANVAFDVARYGLYGQNGASGIMGSDGANMPSALGGYGGISLIFGASNTQTEKAYGEGGKGADSSVGDSPNAGKDGAVLIYY